LWEQRPPLPSSSTSKRKFEPGPPSLDPESYKHIKLSSGVTVTDERPEEDENDDEVAEGEFAPNGDPDYFAEEDEDGRFLYAPISPSLLLVGD
jgi:hypothetical protein